MRLAKSQYVSSTSAGEIDPDLGEPWRKLKGMAMNVEAAAAVLAVVGQVLCRQLQAISAPGNVIGVVGEGTVRAVGAAERAIARRVVDRGSVVHCHSLYGTPSSIVLFTRQARRT